MFIFKNTATSLLAYILSNLKILGIIGFSLKIPNFYLAYENVLVTHLYEIQHQRFEMDRHLETIQC